MTLVRLAAPQKSSDDNLVPLINVVFLMLIFFMVAGQIRATDAVSIMPPDSISDLKQTDSPAKILVSTEQGLYLNGNKLLLSNLSSSLETLFYEFKSDDFIVQVSVDKDLPVSRLQQVMKAIEQAGLTRVFLVTKMSKAS